MIAEAVNDGVRNYLDVTQCRSVKKWNQPASTHSSYQAEVDAWHRKPKHAVWNHVSVSVTVVRVCESSVLESLHYWCDFSVRL